MLRKMNNIKILSLFVPLVLLSVGCSTYSKKTCESMNWESIGLAAAKTGKNMSVPLAHYGQHCTRKHGVVIDHDRFTKGFNTGINTLCTQREGYFFGSTGGRYAGTCPEDKESQFLTGYHKGFSQFSTSEISRLKNRVHSLRDDVQRLERQNSDLRLRISQLQSQMR